MPSITKSIAAKLNKSSSTSISCIKCHSCCAISSSLNVLGKTALNGAGKVMSS
ncbi:Uncharacterised protein [Vibrio cholerae]|nr:Uncharacterised protein [Vibrio cholerae]CSI54775.1 Uncharacterised protein [Vibrio cholerae]